MDLNTVVSDIKLTKVCSIKPFKGADRSKTITLEVTFNRVTLQDVFTKALSATVIQWQNGPGRKQFDQWEDGQIVRVQFTAPGRTIDPEAAMIAKLRAMSPKDQAEYLRNLAAKAK